MFIFDRGEIFVRDLNNSTIQIGSLEKTTLEFEAEYERASTQLKFAAKFVGGKVKGIGTSAFARFNAKSIGKLFFDVEPTTGSKMAKLKEAYTVAHPSGGVYQVTVTPPAGGTFYKDLGVSYATTCLPLLMVAGAPAAGQYHNGDGTTYDFNSADTGKAVTISYLYSVGTGKTVTLTNTYQQVLTTFSVFLYGQYDGKQLIGIFNTCVSSQLTLALMLEDWTKANFKFELQSDNSLNVGIISLGE